MQRGNTGVAVRAERWLKQPDASAGREACHDGSVAMIAVDWGTSNLRAYRMDEHGQVRDHVASANGIKSSRTRR